MGVRFSISDSENLIQAISNNVNLANEVTDRISSGCNHLIASLDSGELQGAAYAAGRGLFSEVIIPAIQKLQAAIDDIKSELSSYQYSHSVASEACVGGFADLEQFKQQVQNWQEQLQEVEYQIERNNDFFYQVQSFFSGSLDNLIAQNIALEQLKEALETSINDYQTRINKLEWFVSDVSRYFSDSLDVLKLAIQGAMALSKVTVDSSGNYYTNGADMSWLSRIKNDTIETEKSGKFDSNVNTDMTLESAVKNLGLNDDTLAYWKKQMKDELKDVPKDQWDEKIYQAAQALKFDKDGNILQIGPFQQGVIVLKNGVYDQALTEQANQELSAENWQAVKDNIAQLFVGGATLIGGGVLSLGGVVITLGGGGLSLTGAGVAVGAPAIAGGISLEGVGDAVVIAGAATASSALSKMNVKAGDVQYSFSTSSEDRASQVSEKATYNPHEKHIGNGSWNGASNMPLSDEEAQKVLDDSLQSGGQRYGLKDGKVYVFQSDDAGVNPTWHGYQVKGNEMSRNKAVDVLKQWLNDGKITKAEYGKLVKGKQ